MEYQVRAARITDIERLVALSEAAPGGPAAGDPDRPLASADLLRQLVYLPQATVLVAESRREVVGGAILALRPSIRAGGFVGTVDLLVVDPEYQDVGIAESLIEELLRSARNKGCVAVEAVQPDDPAERTRWDRYGFEESLPTLQRHVAAEQASARRR